MANVTKISVSLPTSLIAELKREASERNVPVSQVVTEALEHTSKAARFRESLEEIYGPITEADREAGRALLASARTPDEILGEL
jgi:metal-responsive CopG/Arc/MetJ family transcriptional regulator